MLTGDKLETAENIGKSCRLIQPEMSILRLNSFIDNEIHKSLKEFLEIIDICDEEKRKKALLVTGEALGEFIIILIYKYI